MVGLLMIVAFLLLAGCSEQERTGTAQDYQEEHGTHIRETEPKPPEEERQGFDLPPGFEIELFAAEPNIGKPFNIAFDAQGRLWVTQSSNYPFSAGAGEAGDRITILEDTDGDGKADAFTEFADSLSIPIGVLPLPDGGAVAYSIPNLYRFYDDDGDSRADRREVLYGPFGHEDTHGMVNHLKRGFDGWIYACHGYRNRSVISGDDGHTITMVSGNTFRLRSDGSRVESVTTGRVNPFGFAFDKFGYHYSTDSHSDPIYQLIPGGDYPNFSNQPTGIGFAPPMMDHGHPPTARAGLALYDTKAFPPAYRQNLFQGNVRSSRIHRDSLAWRGATPVAVHKEDFLTSEDLWFRPVDMTLGPDGALYVADFYNRIIGHYEVPLDHPGRDHRRGRIWRITYNGDGVEEKNPVVDWTEADLEALVAGLGADMVDTRLRVADQLVLRVGTPAAVPVEAMARGQAAAPVQRVHGLWVLHRLDALPDDLLAAAARDAARVVRVHALRIMAEMPQLDDQQHTLVRDALADEDSHVQRAAVQTLARHPRLTSLDPLLALRQRIPARDSHLTYAARLSLRNHLRQEDIMPVVMGERWDEENARALADVTRGVHSADAGQFLLRFMQRFRPSPERRGDYVEHAARYLPPNEGGDLVAFVREEFADDLDVQLMLFQRIQGGLAQQGAAPDEVEQLGDWGTDLAMQFLGDLPPSAAATWTYTPLTDAPTEGNPWAVGTLDRYPSARFLSSRPRGQQLTGTLRSPVFTLPESFSFVLVGEEDPPNAADETENAPEEDAQRSLVRLRLRGTGEVLKEAYVTGGEAPHQQIEWNLSEHAGEEVYLEVVDGASEDASAYIAVGEFSPPVLQVPEDGPAEVAERQRFAAEVAQTFHLTALAPELRTLLTAQWADYSVRAAAAEALLQLAPAEHAPTITELITNRTAPLALREQVVEAFGQRSSPATRSILASALPEVPAQLQVSLARALAGTAQGADLLMDAARDNTMPPHVLVEPSVKEILLSDASDQMRRRYDEITQDLEPVEEGTQRLIDERLANFNPEAASPAEGQEVFATYCATCHQVGGQGSAIGPNLDGIGSRGAHALVEKILAPNRSVAKGFRMNTVTLEDGEVRTGLFRREEGEVLVFANMQGEEFSIPKDRIAERTESPYTLMPSTFGETIPPKEFHDLLAYLLTLE